MAKNTLIPDSDEERAMRTESGHFCADRARARGESALNLSVVEASPFRCRAKSIPSPAKEQSTQWPTSNPPVAKRIAPVARIFSSRGQSYVLASILY